MHIDCGRFREVSVVLSCDGVETTGHIQICPIGNPGASWNVIRIFSNGHLGATGAPGRPRQIRGVLTITTRAHHRVSYCTACARACCSGRGSSIIGTGRQRTDCKSSTNALEVGSNDARVLPNSVVHLQVMNQDLYLEA